MKACDTCKFWKCGITEVSHSKEWGKCELTEPHEERPTCWISKENWNPLAKSNDGGGVSRGFMMTYKTFGCNQHQDK